MYSKSLGKTSHHITKLQGAFFSFQEQVSSEYSDIMIKGPDSQAVGRLVLDKYSATLYSSSPQTFAAIEHLIEQGFSMDEAIERVAFPEQYLEAAE